MPSLTTENYVKAIYQLGVSSDPQPIATGAIAGKLGVSPGSVTAMLKTLRDAGLVQYARYEGVRLTQSGENLALRVLRRHRLIEVFLAQTLDLTWDEVHEEAEHMEHAVSDRLIDRIDAYLSYPKSDPHGDPIPQSDGTVASAAGTKLNEWPTDQPFQLVRVMDQASDFLRFLTDAGLEIGAVGRICSRTPFASTMTLQVDSRTTVLGDQVAENLIVRAAS